jgi:NDP-sugar pyrophosphorylase family protein
LDGRVALKTMGASEEVADLPVTAILAGGLATRLRPTTLSTPKSLVPVAGQPFIVWQLRMLARQGLTRVVMCAGHLGEQIEHFVGDGTAFGCDVRYSFDGKQALGTGGALLRALPTLGGGFLVLYGDSYLRQPFLPVWDAFQRSGKAALMTVFRNEGQWDRSNVQFESGETGGRILRYDKTANGAAMRHIDYGLGCIRSDRLRAWAREESFDLALFYRAMLEQGELAAFETTERFYEIGSPAGLAETDEFLSRAASEGRPE